MAQLHAAPPSVNLLPSVSSSGKESGATDATRIDTGKEPGATFAAVLKTKSENIRIRPSTQPPPVSNASGRASSTTVSSFLDSLRADTSKSENNQLLAETPTELIASLSPETVGGVPVAASPSLPTDEATNTQLPDDLLVEQPQVSAAENDSADMPQLISSRAEQHSAVIAIPATKTSPSVEEVVTESESEQQQEPTPPIAFDSPQAAPTAAPAGLSSTVLPAPTFSTNKMGKTPPGEQKISGGNSTESRSEQSPTSDKFAAKAAIAAETGKSSEKLFPKESGSGDFSAAMDRGMQNSSALTSIAHVSATSESSSPKLKLDTPLGQAGWRDEFGQKLTWMVNNTRQQADLILNPPHLGRIEVTLSLDGDTANASFFSPHATVREALENSMTRLREVLAEAGVALGQTHVGADPRQNPNFMNSKHDGHNFDRRSGEHYFAATESAVSDGPKPVSIGRGMVDLFA